jgi:hypothetical protein
MVSWIGGVGECGGSISPRRASYLERHLTIYLQFGKTTMVVCVGEKKEVGAQRLENRKISMLQVKDDDFN